MSKRNNNIKFKMQVKQLKQADRKFVEGLLPDHFKFSKHAIDQQKTRKFSYHINEVVEKINIDNVLEVQVQNDDCYKFLIRFNINSIFDLVLVVSANGVICTNWLNSVDDNHATLKDLHLYTTDINKLKNLF